MSREAKVLIAILVVVLGGMIALFVTAGGPQASTAKPVDESQLIKDNTHTTGNGAVKIVEFGDFQCPACGATYPELQRVKQDFGSDITFAFRHFPLQQHANAEISAEASEAAHAQGKFWEMHNQLYEHQADWESLSNPVDKFAEYAQAIGVADIERFKRETSGGVYKDRVASDLGDGNTLGVNSTPTIYVNGVKAANGSYDTLKKMIEDAKSGK
jgi:protein-disulfide isomerase